MCFSFWRHPFTAEHPLTLILTAPIHCRASIDSHSDGTHSLQSIHWLSFWRHPFTAEHPLTLILTNKPKPFFFITIITFLTTVTSKDVFSVFCNGVYVCVVLFAFYLFFPPRLKIWIKSNQRRSIGDACGDDWRRWICGGRSSSWLPRLVYGLISVE